jgi:error-prone DNA polymerase
LRQIKGLSEAAGKKVALLRKKEAFSSIQQLLERAGLNRRDLSALAAAGALKSLDGHRHKVRWAVAGVEEPTPLLTALDRYEAAPMLKKPTEGQNIVADFKSLGLSLERHPIALLRERLDRRRYIPAAQLAAMPTGRQVRVAGLVITKQRPGTASGVTFITLEDESGHVNLIVWRKTAEEQRDVLLAARLMGIEGELQIEGKVIHVIVHRMIDHSGLLGELMVPSREFR